ncbi:WXG100 family type VII secretion target [Actinocorallia sp. B10E7]|uniref:WXG100 family type VII secretion target n=1 Tax=Actinocorallia sp. B10E7 TaxID=3153558 RepID=UPI00325F5BFB
MAPTDYTRVNFQSLADGVEAFRKIHGELDNRLDNLEKYLESNLAEWEGDAVQAYWEAKRIWDQACQDVANSITAMSSAIGNANQNYQDTESANRRIWG